LSWQPFERAAGRYEDWYATAAGRRASRAEKELLAWLLEPFDGARTVLDVGCGTGHFTSWLAERGLRSIGLDRAPAMLASFRRRHPALPAVLADAHALPLRDRAVDVAVFVTTLEFLDSASAALAEAARVARLGIVAVALNRWSVGALSRRLGPASRGTLLAHAHDFSSRELRRLLVEAAPKPCGPVRWRSALLPAPLPAGPTHIPFGGVVGVAAELPGLQADPRVAVAPATVAG
jgi:ubiquinone/menaquinone biosynthesis C-methylase UbiE